MKHLNHVSFIAITLFLIGLVECSYYLGGGPTGGLKNNLGDYSSDSSEERYPKKHGGRGHHHRQEVYPGRSQEDRYGEPHHKHQHRVTSESSESREHKRPQQGYVPYHHREHPTGGIGPHFN